MAAVTLVRILVPAYPFDLYFAKVLKKLSTYKYFLVITKNFQKHHQETLFYLAF